MGKERTKGEKEIRAANAETLRFYKSVVSVTLVVYALVRWFTGFSWFHVVMSISAGLTLSLTYGSMSSAAAGGTDLNMDGGITDYFKDILLVTAAVTLLSLISDYCWYLWLVIPLFALVKLWTGVISPWIFAPAPEDPAAMAQGQDQGPRKGMRQTKQRKGAGGNVTGGQPMSAFNLR